MNYFKDVPYIKELREIRSFLERESPGFPNKKCIVANGLLHRVKRFEFVMGEYFPEGDLSFNGIPHCWSFDSALGLYIDLTQDQFSSGEKSEKNKIVILSKDTLLLRKYDDFFLEAVTYESRMAQSKEVDRLVNLFEKNMSNFANYRIN